MATQQPHDDEPQQLQLTEDGGANFPTADVYKHFEDQRDHVLARPGMYIGGVDRVQYVERIMVFPEDKPQIVTTTIDVPQAIERLYLEPLSNAADNVERSRRAGVDPGVIDIVMDRATVTVRNGGLPIPIEYSNYKDRKGNQMWVPELIFGTLLSGSNYDDSQDRVTSGVNGLGVKLVLCFSRHFTVHIGNANQKLQYTQTWQDHMKDRSDPDIKPYPTGRSFVSVSYQMDFEYFKYPPPEVEGGGYTDEMIALFARHAADISFTAKCPVTFNGLAFSYQNVVDYAQLYFGEKVKTAVVHYEWPPNTETVTRKGQVVAKDPRVIPIVEMCCLDTVDDACCISFVNGMITREGGVHVNAAFKMISGNILEKINSSIERSRKKSKDKKEEGRKRPTLTIADVKPHISMLLSCHLPNPQYVSQSKSSLSGPTPKINIPERLLRMVEKWELMSRLLATVDAKDFRTLAKTDGKKQKYVGLEKLEDANEAAGPRASDCTLFIVEGDSAMGYAKHAISLLPNGHDWNGSFPIKGKPQNVMNLNHLQIGENKEFNDLKRALGLKEGLDYTIDSNYNTLRYGHLLIANDSDVDGYHILGLLLNYFHCRYPTLLQRGYVMYLKTPILRLMKGKQTMAFFTEHEYEKWKDETGAEYKTWKHKYCKGLGSSKPSDIADDFRAPRIVVCLYDDSSPAAFKLAFDKKLTNLRKEWIGQHKALVDVEEVQMQPISQFLYYQMVEYAICNVARSIPRLLDGLKESLRKILWGTLIKWGSKKGIRKWNKKVLTGDVDEFKVAQLGAHVAQYGYRHGETILFDTIVGMSHDFVGKNNLPYFSPEGMLGTRNMGGKDAANARYTFVKPQWWLPLVFRNEDFPLMTMVVDEGETQEPVTFLPIIPLGVVNGCEGIATGYSTYAPCHNPVDVCNWLKARINGGPLPEVLPWFRDFIGEIKVVIRKPDEEQNPEGVKESAREDDPLEPDDIDPETQGDMDDGDPVELEPSSEAQVVQVNKGRSTLITSGVFREENGKVIVTELPIGRWMHNYQVWLGKLIEDGEITGFRHQCGPNTAYFEITGFKNPTLKNLRLQKSFGLTNMVMLDLQNRPKRYTSVQEVLEDFFQQRLPYYDARRAHILATLQTQIDKLSHRMKFIQLVLEGRIIVYEPGSGQRARKKFEILAQMEAHGIPTYIYDDIHLKHLSYDDIEDLRQKIEGLVQDKTNVDNTTPAQMWVRDIDEFLVAYDNYYSKVHESPQRIDSTGVQQASKPKKRASRKAASTRGKGARGRGKGKGK